MDSLFDSRLVLEGQFPTLQQVDHQPKHYRFVHAIATAKNPLCLDENEQGDPHDLLANQRPLHDLLRASRLLLIVEDEKTHKHIGIDTEQ